MTDKLKQLPNIRSAILCARIFASDKSSIGRVEKEHILGLANLLEVTALQLLDARAQQGAQAAQAGWISVSERLPDHGDSVQVWCSGAECAGVAWMRQGAWYMPEPQAIGYDTITHWQPLAGKPVDAPAAPVAQEPVIGWAFHNPDTGWEWHEDHPVESGMAEDATGMRQMSLEQFRQQYGYADAAPPAAEQPECGCCGKTGPCDPDCDCAEQPEIVPVPRMTLMEAQSIIENYAEALKASHAPGGDWEGEEDAQEEYVYESRVSAELRALLAGGAE